MWVQVKLQVQVPLEEPLEVQVQVQVQVQGQVLVHVLPVSPLLQIMDVLPARMYIIQDDYVVVSVCGIEVVPPLVVGVLDVGRGIGPEAECYY